MSSNLVKNLDLLNHLIIWQNFKMGLGWLRKKSHNIHYGAWSNMGSYSWMKRTRIVNRLAHWGRVTHKCQCQAIIWTNAGILLIEPLRTYFSEILIEILTFSSKEMHLKVSSAKWRTFCLDVLIALITSSSDGIIATKWHYKLIGM